ncbi:15157_t:CDS:2 [Funneliformis caledonium]|uniref:Dolichyl-diphosphooligosaccharide-protein glycosyltransferase subunit OST5 n=1 Tax=Funneliformis caledonium TaxID=1117310 RepID=A0A9N8W4E1_9GLOM|nr:15157_t:CDS:2 [Funneliformis caledonium]
MTGLSDWETGKPYETPISQVFFPLLAFLFLLSGFVAASTFSVIKAKTSLILELSSAIPASLSLGFGTLFLFMAVGIYV